MNIILIALLFCAVLAEAIRLDKIKTLVYSMLILVIAVNFTLSGQGFFGIVVVVLASFVELTNLKNLGIKKVISKRTTLELRCIKLLGVLVLGLLMVTFGKVFSNMTPQFISDYNYEEAIGVILLSTTTLFFGFLRVSPWRS